MTSYHVSRSVQVVVTVCFSNFRWVSHCQNRQNPRPPFILIPRSAAEAVQIGCPADLCTIVMIRLPSPLAGFPCGA